MATEKVVYQPAVSEFTSTSLQDTSVPMSLTYTNTVVTIYSKTEKHQKNLTYTWEK